MNWFECKVSYEKMIEGGMQKKVTEPYLVDAMSFTEAEARIIEELQPYITGEFLVADIKRVRLSELFYNEQGDRYYKAHSMKRAEWRSVPQSRCLPKPHR